MGTKSLQDILTIILEQHEASARRGGTSNAERATRRSLAARTLEDRVLYKVTPLMLDESPPPDIESVDADADADAIESEANASQSELASEATATREGRV